MLRKITCSSHRSCRSAQGTAATSSSISGCWPWRTRLGISSQAVLPASSGTGTNAKAPKSILGIVRLVEVGVKPGSRPCSPFLATPENGPGHLWCTQTPLPRDSLDLIRRKGAFKTILQANSRLPAQSLHFGDTWERPRHLALHVARLEILIVS